MDLKLPQNICAGLDIGKSSTKFVALRMVKGRIELVKHAIFHAREEGLVDEEEVVEHVAGWLRELEMDETETRIGLPQYMAMSQVSDFPEAEGQQLDDMVQYEVRQLGGLTDEEFIHDYVRLNPFDDQQNPVFLAECRESVIENRLQRLGPAGIHVEAIHMDGQALADVYLQNQPEDEKDKQILLLDIGGENSTLALVRDGQLIHVGSFLFGGDFFNEALAKRYGMNVADAERMKRSLVRCATWSRGRLSAPWGGGAGTRSGPTGWSRSLANRSTSRRRPGPR
jgi:type IV pilus assembly protein PilM